MTVYVSPKHQKNLNYTRRQCVNCGKIRTFTFNQLLARHKHVCQNCGYHQWEKLAREAAK